MQEREIARMPLLFIDQPTESLPTSMMQFSYSSLHDETPTEKPTEEKTSTDKLEEIVNNKPSQDEITLVQEAGDQVEADVEERPVIEKKFADLTIEEQITYCMKTSPYIPPITCAIKTDTKTIVGSIQTFEDGFVHVQTNKNRLPTKVNIDDITHIRLIGF